MPASDVLSQLRAQRMPVVLALIAAIIVVFVAEWLGAWPVRMLAFESAHVAHKPWSLLTFPFATMGSLLGVLFGSLWLWTVGGMVERDIASGRFAIFVTLFVLLTGLVMWVASMLLNVPALLFGPYGILAFVTVLWGTRYPDQEICFMLVLRLKAKWVAWLSVLFVFFGNVPQLAPFAVLPLVLGWALAANKLPVPYSGAVAARRKSDATYGRTGKVDTRFLADVNRRAREREERERLRKLFEENMIDNEPPPDR